MIPASWEITFFKHAISYLHPKNDRALTTHSIARTQWVDPTAGRAARRPVHKCGLSRPPTGPHKEKLRMRPRWDRSLVAATRLAPNIPSADRGLAANGSRSSASGITASAISSSGSSAKREHFHSTPPAATCSSKTSSAWSTRSSATLVGLTSAWVRCDRKADRHQSAQSLPLH